MEAILDEQDYQVIADKVLQQIRKEYDLVPKGCQKQEFDKWIGIKEMNNVWPYLVILGCFTFAAIYSIGIRHEHVFQEKYRKKH